LFWMSTPETEVTGEGASAAMVWMRDPVTVTTSALLATWGWALAMPTHTAARPAPDRRASLRLREKAVLVMWHPISVTAKNDVVLRRACALRSVSLCFVPGVFLAAAATGPRIRSNPVTHKSHSRLGKY